MQVVTGIKILEYQGYFQACTMYNICLCKSISLKIMKLCKIGIKNQKLAEQGIYQEINELYSAFNKLIVLYQWDVLGTHH